MQKIYLDSLVQPNDTIHHFISQNFYQNDQDLIKVLITHKRNAENILSIVKKQPSSKQNKIQKQLNKLYLPNDANIIEEESKLKYFKDQFIKIGQQMGLINLKLDVIEKIFQTNQFIISKLQNWKINIIQSQQFKSKYFPIDIRIPLKLEIIDYIHVLFDDVNAQKMTQRILKQLNLNFLNDQLSNKEQSKIRKLRKIIETSQKYQLLVKYNGKDIERQKRNLKLQLYKNINFENNISFDLIENIIKNPMYNFMSRQDLSNMDKQYLYHTFWQKPYLLYEYYEIKNYPQTLEFKIRQEINKLMTQFSNKTQLTDQELLIYSKALINFDENMILSAPKLKVYIKQIFIFLRQNCPSYMKKFHMNRTCLLKQKFELLFMLRKQLYCSKVNFNIWQKIEIELIFKGDQQIVDKMEQLNLQIRIQLWQWIKNNLKQLKQINLQESLQEIAKREIEYILLKKFPQIEIQEIRMIIQHLFNDLNLSRIEQLIGKNCFYLKKLQIEIENCQSFQLYKFYDKIDINKIKENIKRQLWFIIHQLQIKKQYLLSFIQLNRFIQNYLIQFSYSSQHIIQQYQLNENNKKILYKKINQNPNLIIYKQIINNINCKKIKKQYLKEVYSKIEDQSLLQYIQIFCNIQYQSQQIICNYSNKKYVQSAINKPKISKIMKQLQQSYKYKSYRKVYPENLNLLKLNTQKQLFKKITIFLKQMEISDKQINFLLKQLSQKQYQINNLINSKINSAIKDRLESYIIYLGEYILIKNILCAQKQKAYLISKIKLQKYIETLFYRMKQDRFNQTKQEQFIKLLNKNQNILIHNGDILSKCQIQFIKQNLQSNREWNQYINISSKFLNNSDDQKSQMHRTDLTLQKWFDKKGYDMKKFKLDYNFSHALIQAPKQCINLQQHKLKYDEYIIQSFVDEIKNPLILQKSSSYQKKSQLIIEILKSKVDLLQITVKMTKVQKTRIQQQIQSKPKLQKIINQYHILHNI